MSNKYLINKIKDNLKSLMKFSEEIKDKKSFSNYDLTDGTKITSPSSDLEIGAEVYALDDQGNQTPLEDGEYVLNDGRTITVSGNSITEVADSSDAETKDPMEDSEDESMVKMEDGLPDTHESAAKEVPSNDVSSRLTDLEKQIEDILNIIKKLGSTQGDVNEQMMSKLESFSKENGGQPIKTMKKDYAGYKSGKSDFMEEIREFNKLKNKK